MQKNKALKSASGSTYFFMNSVKLKMTFSFIYKMNIKYKPLRITVLYWVTIVKCLELYNCLHNLNYYGYTFPNNMKGKPFRAIHHMVSPSLHLNIFETTNLSYLQKVFVYLKNKNYQLMQSIAQQCDGWSWRE